MDQEPSLTKVFISYSHQDIAYRKALLPALQAVRSVGPYLWYDEREIDFGNKFHDEIQQALAATKIGVLLLSNHFLTSKYICEHQLPFLLQQAEQKCIRLAILYVTDVADGALEIDVEVDGQSRPVNLKAYHSFNTPKSPLEKLPEGEDNSLYVKLADWLR